MDNLIIPFGKYKGQPLEVMAKDEQYMEWVQQQDWFKQKYPQINTVIINNFKEPSETPEHNKIQGLFLNNEFCLKFIKVLLKTSKNELNNKRLRQIMYDYESHHCLYEECGADVLLIIYSKGFLGEKILIELKPCVGDDYPAVLRQIKSLKQYTISVQNVLLINEYTGSGLTKNEFIKLFQSQDIVVLFVNDVINENIIYG